MSQPSVAYTIGFATVICLVCGVFVAGSAVSLKDRQEANKVLDRQKKVLAVAGLIEEGEKPEAAQVQQLFDDNIVVKAVNLNEGLYDSGIDVTSYDQRKAVRDAELSHDAPDNKAKVQRVPEVALIYQVVEGGKVSQFILPIEGKGLWSTLYGFMSVDTDMDTIRGLTFYQHGETPGLGGEIDNPKWKASWKGRKIHKGEDVAIRVIKGKAKSPADAPNSVDGLSGATLTCNGVTHTVQFWMGESGFGPFIKNVKSGKVSG
jgi:Na+-transporting NADH:ubiquinone oxidoreductase subunit C